METGVDLDLYFHFRLRRFRRRSKRGKQTEPSGGEREMRVHGVGNGVRQRVSENERVLFNAERAQRQTLGHMRERECADARAAPRAPER